MLHPKIIFRILGMLLFLEAIFLLGSIGISIIYKEHILNAYLYTLAILFSGGALMAYVGRGTDRDISRRDGYIVVTCCWIIFSLFGALPYLFSGYIPSYTDAFFETMSGFTTTGATILDDIESLPHSLLFWRSTTQWVGGLGIVFFTVAVLPIFGLGDIHLFAAEATGPIHGKLHPRISVTARWILTIYVGLTILQAILLNFAGMTVFDAVCHAMTTMPTGGYSTKQAGIMAYDSPLIEYIIIVFMFLGGTNLSLLYLTIFKGRIMQLLKETEFRCYAGLALSFSLAIGLGLFLTTSMGVEGSFRTALFQVVSMQTTTGFASADYVVWMPLLWFLLSFTMFFGGCSGSTGGAMKCIRIAILGRVMVNEFKRIVHPNAVIPVRMSNTVISSSIQSAILAFTVLYIGVVMAGVIVNMAFGLEFVEAYGLSVTCVGNVGPGLGYFGPENTMSCLPPLLKWFGSFQMLVGRLEFFVVLLLLTPVFWRRV